MGKRIIVFEADGTSAMAKGVRAALDAGHDVVIKDGQPAFTILETVMPETEKELLELLDAVKGRHGVPIMPFIEPEFHVVGKKSMADFKTRPRYSLHTSLGDVATEIERSKEMWGDDFDQNNTLSDWMSYVNQYIGKAATGPTYEEATYENLKKAAGLIVTAMTRLKNGDMALRHFEKGEK